jgi:Co/Zn/Cd efflux system component
MYHGASQSSLAARTKMTSGDGYVRTIWTVAVLTVAIGCAEAVYGYVSGSKLLLKDGVEWGYGTVIYAISALSYGRTQVAESRAGVLIAIVLAIGGCQGAYEVITEFMVQEPDDAAGLTASSVLSVLGALVVAGLLFRFRRSHDPVVEGSWLSARNDIITSGLDALVTFSMTLITAKWPRTAVDVVGVALAFQAAFVVGRDAWVLRTATAAD